MQLIIVLIVLVIVFIITIIKFFEFFKKPINECSLNCNGCQLNKIKKQLKKEDIMKNMILTEKRISLNKYFCFQFFYSKIDYFAFLKGSFKLFADDYYFKLGFGLFGDIFNFVTYWNQKMDHAGFTFDITILGVSLHINIYDTRHWDFQENNWKNTYLPD